MVDGPVSPESGRGERRVVRAPQSDRVYGDTLYKAGYLEGDPDHIRYTMVTVPSRPKAAEDLTASEDAGEVIDDQASAS